MNEIKDHFPKVLIIILLLFVSLSVSSPAIAGEFYKWKDKDGNVFFSDTPPPAGMENLGARQRYFGIGMALPVMDFAISST